MTGETLFTVVSRPLESTDRTLCNQDQLKVLIVNGLSIARFAI